MSRTEERYGRWATGTSRESLDRAIRDQKRLIRGSLNAGDETVRNVEAGPSRSRYDTLRYTRDDMDYREWNEDGGYWGIGRWPQGPGVPTSPGEHYPAGAQSEAERRRAARKAEIDEGF
ncbi:MAG: hypothetical protein ACQEXJ_23415 [Myxococcota bacterium]